MKLNRYLISFIMGLILGVLCSVAYGSFSYRNDPLPDFSDTSLVSLNDQLRQISTQLNDHETRLTDGGL